MLNIAIIWPAYPYRWGIAHHTNNLVNTLINSWHRVWLFGFSRQYPKLLYPGKAQLEPEWTSDPLPKLPNFSLRQSIDTLNPISWYRTARMIIKEKPNYCLIKYWHPYFVPCFTIIVWMIRRHKIPIVCIVDNLLPHERHFWDEWLVRFFFSQVDHIVTQSIIVHNQCQKLFPHKPEVMIPHPVYDQFWPPVPKNIACEKLNLPKDKKILLFFGFIRPYKWLDTLISIMPELVRRDPTIHLLIAGECFGSFEMYQKLIDTLNLSDSITLHIQYIPSVDIPTYFGACDLLVMPYRSITNSGIENIGNIYAFRSLLTVWVTQKELMDRILLSFRTPFRSEQKGIYWVEYVMKLLQCISGSENLLV